MQLLCTEELTDTGNSHIPAVVTMKNIIGLRKYFCGRQRGNREIGLHAPILSLLLSHNIEHVAVEGKVE